MQKVATYLDYFSLVENAQNNLMYNYSLLRTITGSGHAVQWHVKVKKLTAELTNQKDF